MEFLSLFSTHNSPVIDCYLVVNFTHTRKHDYDIAYSEVEYKLLTGGLYSNCCDYFRENLLQNNVITVIIETAIIMAYVIRNRAIYRGHNDPDWDGGGTAGNHFNTKTHF